MMNPDTGGRGDLIRIRICMDAETFKSEKRKVYGFKTIRIRVDEASERNFAT